MCSYDTETAPVANTGGFSGFGGVGAQVPVEYSGWYADRPREPPKSVDFSVFSSNTTALLEMKVADLEGRVQRLARYEPVRRRDDVLQDPQALLYRIRLIFEARYPEGSRESPVDQQIDAGTPLPFCSANGCIWSGKVGGGAGSGGDAQDYSLRGIINMELIGEIGNESEAYCSQQSERAILAIRYALVGGYIASMAWQRFSVQGKQEDIVWEALLQHLMAMKRELHHHYTLYTASA